MINTVIKSMITLIKNIFIMPLYQEKPKTYDAGHHAAILLKTSCPA